MTRHSRVSRVGISLLGTVQFEYNICESEANARTNQPEEKSNRTRICVRDSEIQEFLPTSTLSNGFVSYEFVLVQVHVHEKIRGRQEETGGGSG